MGGAWRSYWRHLIHVGAAPEGIEPFAKVEQYAPKPRTPKGAVTGWVPFPPQAIAELVSAARERKDTSLTHAIILGAYTGARIEELCALRTEDVGEASFHIRDAKTQAGLREIPMHSAVRPLVDKLKKGSADGYLLSGLTFNKYGDRSNALGKRFGRLKTAMGYGENHVFHSLRKTLVTLLENAGVPENLTADIVGHEKTTMTYGVYSGGHSLGKKAEALELVSYPGLTIDLG
nr:tyrosine-type recombinase/integrase [Aquabacterium fontiphilum]